MQSDNKCNRMESGKEITEQPNQIKRIDDTFYQVKSQSKDQWYDIISTEYGFKCSCPDHTYRNVCCKHIHAVEFSLKLREQVKSIVIPQIETNNCKFCNSSDIIKKGIRKNRNYNLQIFKCRTCKKRFSTNLGFERMKASPQMITSAMQLYFSGESLRNTQKFLELQGVQIGHVTIYNWIKKYVGLMESYLEKITPQLSDKWRTDEIYLKIKGNKKYLYAMLDDETRFWIAKQVSDKKYMEDVRPMFKEAQKVANKKPKTLISDGANNFSYAFKKEYASWRTPRPQHIRHIHFLNDKNNNKMERFNGEIRDREKVMRGLKKLNTPIIEGYKIYHNYIRQHSALDNKTPAEVSGIKVEGNNKWITLIQNASKQNHES